MILVAASFPLCTRAASISGIASGYDPYGFCKTKPINIVGFGYYDCDEVRSRRSSGSGSGNRRSIGAESTERRSIGAGSAGRRSIGDKSETRTSTSGKSETKKSINEKSINMISNDLIKHGTLLKKSKCAKSSYINSLLKDHKNGTAFKATPGKHEWRSSPDDLQRYLDSLLKERKNRKTTFQTATSSISPTSHRPQCPR